MRFQAIGLRTGDVGFMDDEGWFYVVDRRKDLIVASGYKVDERELIDFCRDRLAAYKYPRKIEILPELPKTPTGKVLRRELRERRRN